MISIITVVYNGEKTLRDTIESVCKQSMLPYEYIIVDGGSSDGTLNIIREYMQKYTFIKCISEHDNGIYDAMNKGISIAEGKLLGIINSDDWYESKALENMWKAYKINGPGVYYGIQRTFKRDMEFGLERSSHEFLEEKMIPHPSTFVSKDVYELCGLFNLKYSYSADLDLIIRFWRQNVKFIPLNYLIANFRIGGVSSTPKAAIESLLVRKSYDLISLKQYWIRLVKLKIKSLMQ